MSWEYKTLDQLGEVSRGRSKHRPRNDPSLFGGEYPFIQTADVKASNFYITEYETTYNKKGLAQSKLWHPGTLCITIAANIADTGILAMDAGISIIPDITPEYAFGKLSGIHTGELDVFVEDEVGKSFLSSIFPLSIRERINIMSIGSDQAILKHMAVHYREGQYNFISFMDGDKKTQTASAIRKIKTELETRIN